MVFCVRLRDSVSIQQLAAYWNGVKHTAISLRLVPRVVAMLFRESVVGELQN
jgi:hypothetical protein